MVLYTARIFPFAVPWICGSSTMFLFGKCNITLYEIYVLYLCKPIHFETNLTQAEVSVVVHEIEAFFSNRGQGPPKRPSSIDF